MKKLLSILLLLVCVCAKATIYYVATTGNDANAGTIDKPFKTLQKISSLSLKVGDIIYIRGGLYKGGSTSNSPQYSWLINGKNNLTISAYPGERVIFDCSDFKYTSNHFGIYIQNSSNLLIKGIRVTGIPQTTKGQVCIGWWVTGNSGGNITLENCEADHIGNTGFRLDNTNNATFLNCDAHHIDNPYDLGVQQHGGSDGFGRYDPSNTSTNTLYKGCRAWFCSDDGWDAFGSPGTITYENCWAFWNGYVQDVFPLTHTKNGINWGDGNGFKLGSNNTAKEYTVTKRFIKNCFAFENYNNGFDQNQANVKMEFYNNTAYKNKVGFQTYADYPAPMVVSNNISYIGGQNFYSQAIQSNNSWNKTVKDTDFVSISNAGVNIERQPDGNLPLLNFMRITSTSKLQGVGALQPSNVIEINKPPVSAITFTMNINLTGAAVDYEGDLLTYLWTQTSGPAVIITDPTKLNASVSIVISGVYKFRLTATDNKGMSGVSEITIVK